MVTLAGRLTRDVELRYTPSQTAVAEWGMATNRHYKGKDGGKKEDVCFVDCVAFSKTADIINKHFHKGDTIFVTGFLKFEAWQAQDGSKRSKLRVLVEDFQFVGGQKQGEPQAAAQASNDVSDDEDIPF